MLNKNTNQFKTKSIMNFSQTEQGLIAQIITKLAKLDSSKLSSVAEHLTQATTLADPTLLVCKHLQTEFFQQFKTNGDMGIVYGRAMNGLIDIGNKSNAPYIPKLDKQENMNNKFMEALNEFKKKTKEMAENASVTDIILTQQREMRLETLKAKATTSAAVSGTLALVFNVNTLMNGEFLNYVWNVGKDVTIAASTSALGTLFEEVPVLNQGAGVIVLGVVDILQACKSGNWERVGLNASINTISSVSAGYSAYYGGLYGAYFGPWGVLIGGLGGALIGGIGGRMVACATPLGAHTSYEKTQMMTEVRNKIDAKMIHYGVRLDPTTTWDEFQKHLAKNELKFVPTDDIIKLSPLIKKVMSVVELLALGTNRTDGLQKMLDIIEQRC